jgi:hypothetical protein
VPQLLAYILRHVVGFRESIAVERRAVSLVFEAADDSGRGSEEESAAGSSYGLGAGEGWGRVASEDSKGQYGCWWWGTGGGRTSA